jgi:hypothetical protein
MLTPLHPSETIKNRLVGKLRIRRLCSPSFNLSTIMVIGTSNPQIIKSKLDSHTNPSISKNYIFPKQSSMRLKF